MLQFFLSGTITIFFLNSCQKPFHGKYLATGDCFLLEWIKVYPDHTADIKYRALSEEFNVDCEIQDDSVVVLKERNRTWYWVYRRDTLREGSHNDNPFCRLIKTQN